MTGFHLTIQGTLTIAIHSDITNGRNIDLLQGILTVKAHTLPEIIMDNSQLLCPAMKPLKYLGKFIPTLKES